MINLTDPSIVIIIDLWDSLVQTRKIDDIINFINNKFTEEFMIQFLENVKNIEI